MNKAAKITSTESMEDVKEVKNDGGRMVTVLISSPDNKPFDVTVSGETNTGRVNITNHVTPNKKCDVHPMIAESLKTQLGEKCIVS